MSVVTARPSASARALLEGVVDYAGLFPPASWTMADAVTHHAAQRAGSDAWMLGRFVVPAVRLAEFSPFRISLGAITSTWNLSAVVGVALDADFAAVAQFNEQTAPSGAVVNAIEVKADTTRRIEEIAARLPSGLEVFVELPLSADPHPLLRRLSQLGLGAKVRTGGTTADAFPTPGALAHFLAALVSSAVPFKASAGLHHPVSGVYRLTYASDAPTGTMYGYLNVLLGTAALHAGWTLGRVTALLEESDASAFVFGADEVRWRGTAVNTSVLSATRSHHLRSFGSCSFREPVDEVWPIVFPTT